MGLLRGRAAVARDDEIAGGEAFGFAAAATEESDGRQAPFFCLVQGGEDVGGVAAGGEDHEQILGAGETGDLAGEGMFVAVVVDHAGEQRAVGGEGDGGERAAVFRVAADELGREVGRFGGAATVAADQKFPAAPERGENHFAGAINLGADFGEGLQRAEAVSEGGFEGTHGGGEESSG